jgi:hypothetical protein
MILSIKEYITSRKRLFWFVGYLLLVIFLFIGLKAVFFLEARFNVGIKARIFIEFSWIIGGSMLFTKITKGFWTVAKKEKVQVVEKEEEQK